MTGKALTIPLIYGKSSGYLSGFIVWNIRLPRYRDAFCGTSCLCITCSASLIRVVGRVRIVNYLKFLPIKRQIGSGSSNMMDSGDASTVPTPFVSPIQVWTWSNVRQARDALTMKSFESQDGASDDTKVQWTQNSTNASLVALCNVMEFTPQDLLWPPLRRRVQFAGSMAGIRRVPPRGSYRQPSNVSSFGVAQTLCRRDFNSMAPEDIP